MNLYLELIRRPGAWWLILGSLPGRFAFSMSGLAIFFHLQQVSGSLAAGGTAVGAYVLASSLSAAARGRLVDHWGQTKPLALFVPSYVTSLIVIAFVGDTPRLAIALAAVCGLTAPPFNISIRPLWLQVAGPKRVRTAYALDSTLMNTAMLAGPVAATWIALSLSSTVALVICAGAMLLGGTVIGISPVSRSWRPEKRVEGEIGLLRSPAIRLLALEGAFLGFAMGLIHIAIPASATVSGKAHLAGPLLAAVSLGSIIGGVVAGARLRRVIPINGLVATQIVAFACTVPLAFLDPGWAMAAALFSAGLANGPAHIFYMELVDLVRPRGTAATALATLWTIEGSASALGSASAGHISEAHSPSWALGLAAVLVLASPILMWWGRRDVLAARTSPLPQEAHEPASA
jgi:MFS family permease